VVPRWPGPPGPLGGGLRPGPVCGPVASLSAQAAPTSSTQMVSRKRGPALGLATATGVMTSAAARVSTRLTRVLSNLNAAELSSPNAGTRPEPEAARPKCSNKYLMSADEQLQSSWLQSQGRGSDGEHRRRRDGTTPLVRSGPRLPCGRSARQPGWPAHPILATWDSSASGPSSSAPSAWARPSN